MGLFGKVKPSPAWLPLQVPGWDEVRLLLPGKEAMDEALYFIKQVQRTEKYPSLWSEAMETTRELHSTLVPRIEQRLSDPLDVSVLWTALARGWLLSQEDAKWYGATMRSDAMPASSHNAICLLRKLFAEEHIVAVNRGLEAGYFLGRTGSEPDVIASRATA